SRGTRPRSPPPTHLEVSGDTTRSRRIVLERRRLDATPSLRRGRRPPCEVSLRTEDGLEDGGVPQSHHERRRTNSRAMWSASAPTVPNARASISGPASVKRIGDPSASSTLSSTAATKYSTWIANRTSTPEPDRRPHAHP